jgi:hypothetical protein
MKPGDIVELKTRTIRFYVKNLAHLYLRQGSGEFETGYASELAMFLGSFLKKAPKPVGKVVGFGARIDGEDKRFITVKVRNKFGKSDVLALLEQDVTLVKRKK